MEHGKLTTLQSNLWEDIQGKSMDKIEKEIGASLFLLRLDARIDFEEWFKAVKAKGIEELAQSNLLNNQKSKEAAQLLLFTRMLGQIDNSDIDTTMESLDHLLHMDISSIEVTNDIYQDKFLIEIWNNTKAN